MITHIYIYIYVYTHNYIIYMNMITHIYIYIYIYIYMYVSKNPYADAIQFFQYEHSKICDAAIFLKRRLYKNFRSKQK